MTSQTAPACPRGEYPRPQFVRPDWLCLNGRWQFEIDCGDSGIVRGLKDRELAGEIAVPFCPESSLSGVGTVDFMNAVWYRRDVAIPAAWAGRKVLLHFQAVEYEATVWVNGVEVARHRGGFSPFAADLGGVAEPGTIATVVVRARDLKGQPKPGGKQSTTYENQGCMYTRTTGIWQTVWMEPVPQTHMRRPRVTPDVASGRFHVVVPIAGCRGGLRLRARLADDTGEVARAETAVADFSPRLELAIPEARRRLWDVGAPHLYDITLELVDVTGRVVDRAGTYAGLRSVTIDGMAVEINGRPVFQRLVLDQGYYPDGILTAPSDEALERDIELSIAAGFNGARLHQKVFEERFLYHADRKGYLVWGEFPDWGIDRKCPDATYVAQWLEVLERDYSHPSIVGWCPLNETAEPIPDEIPGLDDVTRAMFLAAKAMDPTRPVLDTSGYSHRVAEADIYDCHDYEQDAEKLRRNQAGLAGGAPFVNGPADMPWSIPYRGQPYFVSEFGGIWWNAELAAKAAADGRRADSWGYGERVRNLAEFYARFAGLCGVLLDDAKMFGYCYTQLTDVYQEQNGIYAFDRSAKFDIDRIRAAQVRAAAIERR
jgi:beta-galactosidase/beta-glucuronidase